MIPLSFHVGLGMAIRYEIFFCLHDTISLSTAVISLYTFCSYCPSSAAPLKNGWLVVVIMRFRTELIPDSTIYRISDWFHGTFGTFSFENAKTSSNVSDLVRFRVTKRTTVRYGMKTVSCKPEANLI